MKMYTALNELTLITVGAVKQYSFANGSYQQLEFQDLTGDTALLVLSTRAVLATMLPPGIYELKESSNVD